jgi:predicted 3-demethylubiquinone-9 3-methyltransferase (glyoxalase superfamily)
VKDKFGLSWPIVPNVFLEMIQDKDPVRVKRVIDAMLQMKKLDIATLEKAFHQQ